LRIQSKFIDFSILTSHPKIQIIPLGIVKIPILILVLSFEGVGDLGVKTEKISIF